MHTPAHFSPTVLEAGAAWIAQAETDGLEHAGQLRPLLLTAVFTGLRASELRGLTWDAVDLDCKVLTVRQRADRWNTIGSPKSGAAGREVPLTPIIVNTCAHGGLSVPVRR